MCAMPTIVNGYRRHMQLELEYITLFGAQIKRGYENLNWLETKFQSYFLSEKCLACHTSASCW